MSTIKAFCQHFEDWPFPVSLSLQNNCGASAFIVSIKIHRHRRHRRYTVPGTGGAGGTVLQEKGTWSEQVACGDVKPRPLSVLQIRPNNIVMHGGAKKHGL